MSRIEDEAAEHVRKKAAERQARHRAKIKTYYVKLDSISVGQLMRAREIPPDANDTSIAAEIANVVIAALSGRLRVVPPLPAETRVDLSPADGSQPKAKGKHRRKIDPGRTLVGAEKARIAAQVMAEEERLRVAEEQEARIETRFKYDPVEERQHRLKRIDREKREKEEAVRAKIAALPNQAPKERVFQSLGKSGISKKGGKPVTNGFGSYPYGKSQSDTVPPIKRKPTAAEMRNFTGITPADNSIHTLQATNAELHEMYSGAGTGHEKQ